MLQCLEMSLCIQPQKKEFDCVVREAYDLMLLLKNAELGIEPNYQKVRRKSDAKLIDWSYENFYKLMKRELEQGKEDLGVIIGFFSSLVDQNSAGISLAIGCSNKLFKNSLNISFPYTMEIDHKTTEKIETLFKQCIDLLHPFYGAITNNKNVRRFGTSIKNGIPTTVNWINYYASPELLSILDKAEGKYIFYKKEKIHDGYYFRIKELPIDDDRDDDIKLQAEINRILELN